MSESKEKLPRSPWNLLFWVVVTIGGFFALLGPCLYFRGFTESDPEYRLVQTREAPDERFLADALHYRGPGKEAKEAIIVELRAAETELRGGRRVFVADPDLFVDHHWLNARTLVVEYRVSSDGRKPDRMLHQAMSIELRYDLKR
ncbi:MAG: hypothetical protein V3W41_13380 [Planctomycetota bacterium]